MTINETEVLRPRDLLILGLSLYVLVALVIESLFSVSPDVHFVLETGDNLACVVFLADFFHRLIQAPNKLRFMKWGWIDLVTSIPAISVLRWGRLIRVLRLVRLVRAARGAVSIVSSFKHHRSEAAATLMFVSLLFTLLLSSIAILSVETGGDSNIHTGSDALWWAISTISTVGYGDKFPVTMEGKMIAGALMLVGIGLMGALTGFIASSFVRDDTPSNDEALNRVESELARLRHEVAALTRSKRNALDA